MSPMALVKRVAHHGTNDHRGLDYVSKRVGVEMLDEQAQKYFGLSGSEFKEQYRSGALRNADRSKVKRVALLIPFTED